jgi:exonuclease SbcC
MKILAIRGKNLASLSTEFEVDFQSEPLASAGLYAITGPTGSGKSTLLDALCLALYEKTPRLTGVGRSGDIPDVGDNGITPGDVRTILRRGAAEGFAEVDFAGSDGIAYRSRWTVRRARSKADGKMQNSEISLSRILDGQQLGDHRKTETLRMIESSIGLSFDQFTRAVLLAQNDFSAFLKASDDDRAELLQTLTGTEAFSAISIRAFDRMKMEKEQLARLQGQLKDQEPLAPEIRAAKDTEFKAQSGSVKTLEQQKSVLESHLRWYQQWEQFKSAESDAGQKLEEATLGKHAAKPRYEQLVSAPIEY